MSGPEPAAAGPAAARFGARLLAALAARAPLCVGIDPHASLLADWGLTDDATGLERFALAAVEAVAPEVAVVKPQSAFFERHGAAGIAVLERTIAAAQSAGAMVLLDVKRGDIGSTVQAYADAYLSDRSPLAADAVTVNPYLGYGSLRPFLQTAQTTGRGVFVLTLTSNPDGASVQRALAADPTGVERPDLQPPPEPRRSVAQMLVDAVGRENHGAEPLGDVGVVIGATVGALGVDLDGLNGPVLVPGLGAQGADPADIRRLFGGLPGVLPSSSRAILAAGPGPAALRDAVRRTVDSLLVHPV